MKFKYLLILPLILLTGCYNYQELNNLAIVSAIGIDKIDNEYQITAQVINTNKNEQSDNINTIVYTAKAENIQKAIRNTLFESPNKLYIQQLQILLISEDVAKEGITNILDYFFRAADSEKRFYVLIAKDTKAEDILKILSPSLSVGGSDIAKVLETENKYLGISELLTFEDLMNYYLSNTLEISIPSITLKGNVKTGKTKDNIETSDPDTKIFLSNTAFFKNDKLINYLNQDDSFSLNFLKGNVKNTIISAPCNDNKYVVVRIINVKTNKELKDNKITIEIKGKANLSELTCNINLEKEESIKTLENDINKEIEKSINELLNNLKKDNTDTAGLLDMYYKNNYNYYLTIKDNWYTNYYQNTEVEIKSNIKILGKGNILKEINND